MVEALKENGVRGILEYNCNTTSEFAYSYLYPMTSLSSLWLEFKIALRLLNLRPAIPRLGNRRTNALRTELP